MAKSYKKKVKSPFKRVKKIDKNANSFKMKDCVVKLNRIDKTFLQRWLNPPKIISLTISQMNEHRIEINNTGIEAASPYNFNIDVKIKNGKIFIGPNLENATTPKYEIATISKSGNHQTNKQMIAKTLVQLLNEY